MTTRTAKDLLDNALSELTEAGNFTSKAAQKRALDNCNRAYELIRRVARDGELAYAYDMREQGEPEEAVQAFFERNETPFDLHQVRDRHMPVFGRWLNLTDGNSQSQLLRAIKLRAEIKATEVVAPVKDDTARKVEERVQRSIREEMDRLGRMYCEALDIGRMFNGMPVSANVHMVVNAHGTRFVRAFYYLNGKRMPLNTILAAAGTLADEKKETSA